MAEQPKYFNIEDTQTGKKYRIETDDPNATYDEAVEYFSALPETEWQQYEYNVPAPAASTAALVAAPAAQGQAPSVEATRAAAPASPLVGSGVTQEYSPEFVDRPDLASAAEGLWQAGVRDPKVFNEKISSMLGRPFTGITNRSLAQLRQRDAYYKSLGLQNPGNFIAKESTGVAEPEAPDGIIDTLQNALARGAGQVYNSGVGLAALGSDLVGADETADSLLQQYIENNVKMDIFYKRPVESFKEIEGFGDAGLYALDALGEMAPGLIGSMGGGYVGKEAAKKIVAKSVDDIVEQQIANGVSREAAELAAKQYVDKIAQKGIAAGTFSGTFPQEAGTIFGQTYSQTGEKAPGLSLLAATFSASLDSFLPAETLKKLSIPQQVIEGRLASRLTKEAGKGFVIEGATEALQEFISELPSSVITGESPFTKEMLDRMTEAFVKGGVGGSIVSSASQGVAEISPGVKANTPETAPPSGRIIVPTSRKNSKKYMAELDGAATEMVAQVNELAKGWSNAPNIEVHNNFSKLDGVSDTAIGVYTEKTLDDGTKVPVVKINAEAVLERAKKRDVSPESVVEAVTFHEALGHHGLTQLFREDLDEFLDDIYTNGSEQFRDKVDTWLADNPRAYSTYDEASRRILATEEVMAEWSEGGPLARSFYDTVANYIKDFARTRLGMDLKYTEREVKAFLAVAHERVQTGGRGGATPSAPRNMIVYHGSPYDFERFDHSHMGKGEGRQVFGWGSYFTSKKSIAEGAYRDRLAGEKVSFNGVEAPAYTLRENVKRYAELEDISPEVADAAFSLWQVDRYDVTPEKIYEDWAYSTGDNFPDSYFDLPDDWRATFEKMADIINTKMKVESSGKLYEVDLPDDAKWLEWENSIESQPELQRVLEEEGIDVPPNRTGELAYRLLAEKLTPKGASERLAQAGFAGNRYVADNLRKNRARKNDGTDVFNYVVFDDKTPKIVNKYMEGDGPINPDDLTADDLIEARNALDILNRIKYEPKFVSADQLEAEAISRNLPPSDITRLVGMEPGKLMRKLFLYDVAATKLSDRAAKIKADIDANGLTPERQAAYIETTATLSDLASRIFDFQAEIGRTLAANRRVNFSRKRVRDLQTVLKEYGAEALADPETFMKYMAEVEAQMKARGGKTEATYGDKIISWVNVPRSIMSSMDLSAPLRQGIVFVGHRQFWGSFLKMFSMLGKSGESNYQFLTKKIATSKNYELMQRGRLAFSSLDGELSAREESFQTELARKIPGVRMSERAYSGFLNKLRADMFDKFLEEYRKAGIFNGTAKDADGNTILTPEEQELIEGLGRFINSATGRAELTGSVGGQKIYDFRKMSAELNATFFSARLMQSRVNMLNPIFYKNLPAPVRKQALKSMLSFGTIGLLVNGAINVFFPDAETELDPRSSDFLKPRFGNTRFDLGGGFNQYLVLGARTATWLYNQSVGMGERLINQDVQDLNFVFGAGLKSVDFSEYKVANKKTSAGDLRNFGTQQTEDTYGSVLADFFRSKMSPQASYVVDFLNEKDYVGNEFTIEGSLASRLVPMTASGLYDAYAEDSPVPLPVIFATSVFGIGVTTYTAPGMDPKRELEAPVSFEMSDLENGQNDFIRAEDGVVTLKKPARDAWAATLNNYYPVFVQEVSAEMGAQFEEMDDDMKKATIKEALKRTRAAAKKDMMYELGLE